MAASSRFFDGTPPRVIAHRGLAVRSAENTLDAFRAALQAGADIIETDVHASADGVAVICHDNELTRIAGVERPVEQLTWARLRELELVGGGRLATLAQALAAFPDARFNVDIKTEAALRPAIGDILEARAESRVLVTAFQQRRRRRAVRALHGVATSASTPGVVLSLIGARLRLAPVVRMALRRVDAVQVPRRRSGLTVVSPAYLRAVHDAGREVHVWTVNDPEEMAELVRLGVEGIVTDRCDLLVDVLERSEASNWGAEKRENP
ncbi:glycerophosphodiester phosphodiesterase family protein [Humibacter sp.]|jgi:glycerophosphoryl diester phosphodiesterase|uniref:glycerophosphodiester phosphodiesterase family protein n=1 Tax=Humibacter sp. TaxID=1940291 RepID=UPI002C33AA3F|nr:glycerophosphodiester phosphodiesterase family protein [Humibacter sp.]HVX08673.1 glycerophosphodiester phosphodiesterase family protein [Humibacter sp.]